MSAAAILAERRVSMLDAQGLLCTLAGAPWAITRDAGERLIRMLTAGAGGERIQAAAAKKSPPVRSRSVAGIGLYGYLFRRPNFLTEFGLGTAMTEFAAAVRELADDDTFDEILIDVDSPGGTVHGTEEAALAVLEAARKKPVRAVVNSLAASGAYWIASQATELIASPSSQLGSVGAFVMHVDYSGANEKAGVKITYISTSERKVAGNPDEPLSDVGREEMRQMVTGYHDMFVRAVARGRETTVSDVRANYGDGGMLLAQAAVARGMADRVGTLDEVVSRMLGGSSGATASRTRPAPTARRIDPETERRRRDFEADEETDRRRRELDAEKDHEFQVAIRRRKLLLDEDSTRPAAKPPATPAPTNPHPVYTGWHEAGHVVARLYFGDRECSATIIPGTFRDGSPYLGLCVSGIRLGNFDEAVVRYAGCVAGDYSPQQPRSRTQAGSGDDEQAEQFLAEYRDLHRPAIDKARKIIANNAPLLRALAEQLVARQTLSAREIATIASAYGVWV